MWSCQGFANGSISLGLYKCVAENEYGITESSIYIRPTIEKREVTEELLVEESINEVIGFQKPQEYVKKVSRREVFLNCTSVPSGRLDI